MYIYIYIYIHVYRLGTRYLRPPTSHRRTCVCTCAAHPPLSRALSKCWRPQVRVGCQKSLLYSLMHVIVYFNNPYTYTHMYFVTPYKPAPSRVCRVSKILVYSPLYMTVFSHILHTYIHMYTLTPYIHTCALRCRASHACNQHQSQSARVLGASVIQHVFPPYRTFDI